MQRAQTTDTGTENTKKHFAFTLQLFSIQFIGSGSEFSLKQKTHRAENDGCDDDADADDDDDDDDEEKKSFAFFASNVK